VIAEKTANNYTGLQGFILIDLPVAQSEARWFSTQRQQNKMINKHGNTD